jgi:Zn-dependent peptidase ImmA (M78 family)/DNA-binding XRE family transcriptional regulator
MPADNVIGENVVRIRTARAETQKGLAERAGLSRLALSRIERGEAVPRAANLNAIAKALRVPVKDLVTPVRRLESVRFRARKRMRERAQVLAQVSSWLDDYCAIEEILEDKTEFSLRKWMGSTAGGPRQRAEMVRKTLGIDNEPIRDICGLLEQSGVKVLRLARATDRFFGLSVGAVDGGPAIAINTWEKISVERWIFSAAHELGHLLLHPHAYDRDAMDEPKEEEREADLFASYLLMPEHTFDREWRDACGHSLYDRVIKVKRIFQVSYRAVLFRLVQKGLADQRIYARFQVQHKRRHGRTLKKADEPKALTESFFDASRASEPARLSDADCLDDRLWRLVRLAVESHEITLNRGAEILGLSLPAMRQLTAEWAR